jgi:hypothetical protein
MLGLSSLCLCVSVVNTRAHYGQVTREDSNAVIRIALCGVIVDRQAAGIKVLVGATEVNRVARES